MSRRPLHWKWITCRAAGRPVNHAGALPEVCPPTDPDESMRAAGERASTTRNGDGTASKWVCGPVGPVQVPAEEVTAFFYTRPREGTRLGSPARKYALGLSPSVGRTEAGEAAPYSSRSPAWRIRLHLLGEDANFRTRPEPHILGTYGPVVVTMVLANVWTWVFRHSAG